MGFEKVGLMIDCSRNAVMRPEFVKDFIDITSELGYNRLMLYTEDTYEVDNEPFFGHLRGRYSKAELKELDAYARAKGVELVPCIQTLAHLGALMKWNCYNEICDCNDILLAGEERTYELIENMFKTIAECFSSRTMNVGMDEAWMLGKGKYLDRHGVCDRVEILLTHLKRVSEIAKKYGFTLQMWGDMFFHLASSGYHGSNPSIPDDVAKAISEKIPDNVKLVYWDYYSKSKEHYDDRLREFQKLDPDTAFAGGFWTWAGFAPKNAFSLGCSKAAVEGCIDRGVKEVFFTMWGDCGGECSRLAVLPSLFYISGLLKGKAEGEIKAEFEEKYGIAFDDFILLDLPFVEDSCSNPERYFLYNDPFLGRYDSVVKGVENEWFAQMADRLRPLESHERFGYLFTTQRTLCEVLAIKAELGVRTRKAYLERDMEAIKVLIGDYSTLMERVEDFYEALEYQWMTENKPHGFDVQDIRLGGLKQRISHCTERLEDFVCGETDRIEELEEPVLHPFGADGELPERPFLRTGWIEAVTPNNLW